MKLHAAVLVVFLLPLGAAPATAQVLYDNGPINGTVDAWTINFGYIVSDTFTLLNNSTVTGFDAGMWEFPGDTLVSLDWSMTSQEFGGTLYASGTASGKNLTDTFISLNQYGYNIDEISVTGLNVSLNAKTYWLNLANASVPSGDPVYWDENNGVGCGGDDGKGSSCPSMPSENGVGSILSESFDVKGNPSGGTTPEPGSLLLFASGALGLAGLLWRRLS
jgi:hypothetical protein